MDLWQLQWWQIGLIVFGLVYTYLIVYQIYETRFLKTKVERIKEAMQRSEPVILNPSKDKEVEGDAETDSALENEPAKPNRLSLFFDQLSETIISLERTIRNYIQWILDRLFTTIRVGLHKFGIRNV